MGKTAARLLTGKFRVSALVFARVGQAGGGAMGHFMRLGQEFLGLRSGGDPDLLQDRQRQTAVRLAIGARALVGPGALAKAKEGLQQADHFPAGTGRIEDLPEKRRKGAR
jgi:hypothetical protein